MGGQTQIRMADCGLTQVAPVLAAARPVQRITRRQR